jgi:hypothetical protein
LHPSFDIILATKWTLYPVPLSILRNIAENFERPALTDHVILVGAPMYTISYLLVLTKH